MAMAYFDTPTDRATEHAVASALKVACLRQLELLAANPLSRPVPAEGSGSSGSRGSRGRSWVEAQVARALASEVRALEIAEKVAAEWLKRLGEGVPLGEVYAVAAEEGEEDEEEEEEEELE